MTTPFLRLLVYSPPGHGKTTLIGSGYLPDGTPDPRLMPMLLLNFEAGHDSIASKLRDVTLETLGQNVDPTKIDNLRIRKWEDFDTVMDKLEGMKPMTYRSIGIDSLSEVGYLCLRACITYAKGKDRGSKHDPDIPEQQDYQRNAVRMREMVRFFRDLDLHVVFAAAVLDNDITVCPALPGKLPNEVMGLMSTVGYLGIDESKGNERVLIVSPTPRFQVKDRSEGGKLGSFITAPTLSKILDLLEGKIQKEG